MIHRALAAARAAHAPIGALIVACLLSLPASAQVTGSGTTGTTAVPADERAGDEAPGVLGEPQTVDVDVGADARISSIVLFHRFAGETDYSTTPMRAVGGSGLYSATVPTAGVDAPALEFYVLAEERSGDTLFKGSAFAPIVRELVTSGEPSAPVVATAPADAAAPDPAPAPAPEASGRRYLYIALGALAVGAAVAAAASSGGDGGSDDGCTDGRCGLTIALPEP